MAYLLNYNGNSEKINLRCCSEVLCCVVTTLKIKHASHLLSQGCAPLSSTIIVELPLTSRSNKTLFLLSNLSLTSYPLLTPHIYPVNMGDLELLINCEASFFSHFLKILGMPASNLHIQKIYLNIYSYNPLRKKL